MSATVDEGMASNKDQRAATTSSSSLHEISNALDGVLAELSSKKEHSEEEDADFYEDACILIKEAMSLETPETRSELASLLQHVSVEVSKEEGTNAFKGLVLNNLGCVKRRLGEMKDALHFLRSAAEAEGGINAASPVTLLNIASVYSALQMYAEAAAVSNHAAYRCETSVQPVPIMLHAAALHNLGVALEGSGEIEHAQKAYKASQGLTTKAGVPQDHPQLKATQNALAQLELKLRNQRARTKRADWSSSVERTVIQKSIQKLNEPDAKPSTKSRKELSSSAPPTVNASSSRSVASSRRLMPLPNKSAAAPPALQHRSDGDDDEGKEDATTPANVTASSSVQLSPIAHRHSDQDISSPSAMDAMAVSGPLAATSGSGLAYGSSVKKFHVFRDKGSGKMLPYKKIEQQAWDTNPFVAEPSRAKINGSDVAIERSVSHAFVPHHVVPLLADLRYKETTRRNTIKRDFAHVMQSVRAAQDYERIFISEDEERIEEEIQELRERRVLVRWMRAKEVFVRGAVTLEGSEKDARTVIMAEHIDVLKRDVRPTAQRLQVQAMEEVERGQCGAAQLDARNSLLTQEETGKAIVRVEEEITFSKRGLAHGLVLWCMEGAVSPEEAVELADPVYANSHFVLQRHNWFGKPYGHGGKADSDVENKVYLNTSQKSSV